MGAFVIYYALAQLLLIHLHSAELFLRETAEKKKKTKNISVLIH